MIKFPVSVQSEYSLCWSGDPALQLPEDPAERERELSRARLTGQWPTIEGQTPTRFQFRNLELSDISWIQGESANSTEHGRPLSGGEANVLTVRLALTSIENFGSLKVERARVGSQPKVATTAAINALAKALGPQAAELINEFAEHIVRRASGTLDPL